MPGDEQTEELPDGEPFWTWEAVMRWVDSENAERRSRFQGALRYTWTFEFGRYWVKVVTE